MGSTQFLSARTADLSTGRLPGMPEAVHMSSAAYAASAPFRDAIIQEASSRSGGLGCPQMPFTRKSVGRHPAAEMPHLPIRLSWKAPFWPRHFAEAFCAISQLFSKLGIPA